MKFQFILDLAMAAFSGILLSPVPHTSSQGGFLKLKVVGSQTEHSHAGDLFDIIKVRLAKVRIVVP
jgi:hypothetical protein